MMASRMPAARFAMHAIGLVVISAALALMIKATQGISVVSSVSYILSLAMPQLSTGTWSYIYQAGLIVLLAVILRRFSLSYLTSFLVSMVFGYAVDFFKWALSGLPVGQLPLQLAYMAGGLAIMPVGIAMMIHSGLTPMPIDLFVRDLVAARQLPFQRVKTVFDLANLVASLLLLLLVLRRWVGIGAGTVLAALLNGTMIGFWIRLLKRRFPLPDRLAPALKNSP